MTVNENIEIEGALSKPFRLWHANGQSEFVALIVEADSLEEINRGQTPWRLAIPDYPKRHAGGRPRLSHLTTAGTGSDQDGVVAAPCRHPVNGILTARPSTGHMAARPINPRFVPKRGGARR
jgi:hypothetical protein